jgi:hypothetical protein
MDEQQSQANIGPVTIDDVAEALGDADPNRTNAAAIRRTLGRGSLSTIQKYLEALRRERRDADAGIAEQEDIEAPEAPKSVRGLWEAAYSMALATVQDRLIRAQGRIADLESIQQGQREEIEVMAELVDQVESERNAARAEAVAAREAQARAEVERDAAMRLRDQIAALMAKIDAMQQAAK